MPQQAETLPKSSRGSRRRPRKSTSSTQSHTSLGQNNAEFAVAQGSPRESDQPTRILRRNDYNAAPDVSVVGNLELPTPTTPPRPRSMYDGFSSTQYQGNQSAPDMNHRRKKGRKSHGGITRASGIPRNEAPLPAPPQQPLTPSRPHETPVKAYAGPSFLGSPAASSLPTPKFISRSVPNVDKTSSLKNMMEREAVDTTSESDNSPFLENSRLTQDRQIREDSPLDIFFQADRDAKAKAQIGRPAVSNGLRSESQNDVRHHSRQPTDSSLGGMFTMEMDGAVAEIPDSKKSHEPMTPVPQAMTEADHRDEQRKVQTQELKKLLYSPEPTRSVSSSPCSSSPPKGLGSPSPKIIPRGGSPRHVLDLKSKEQQRQAILLALAQKQISGLGTNTGSTPQRPPSKLSKEISVPSSPGVQPPELHASPTHPRVQNASTPSKGHAQHQQKGRASPYSPLAAAYNPPAKPPGGFQISPSRNSRDAKTIEEDLRRILKLDVIGGDDVTGVRS